MDIVNTELRAFEPDYTEFIEQIPRSCPVGRYVRAQLQVRATATSGPSPRKRGTIALIVETRRAGASDDEFEEVARTPTFFIDEQKIAQVVVPAHPAPDSPPAAPGAPDLLRKLKENELPDQFRCRIVFTGRLRPFFDVGLIGM